MRRWVAKALIFSLLISPVSGNAYRDTYEIKGDLEYKLGLPYRGSEGTDITLFGGRAGGGFTPFGSACGLNAGMNFMYGVANNLMQLQEFLTNWQSAATIVGLYALATYLPVAKEAIMGANTLSNFLAQLTSFSCSQAMETIKELNMQDSYLVKKCIANKLGINDPDTLKKENPQKWYEAYKFCLNNASFLDIFGGDRNSALRYLSLISPKSMAKCYLGVRDMPTAEEIANADLTTRAKYFLYAILPDFKLTADGLVKVETLRIRDPNTGQVRPASLIDFTNFHVEQMERDYEEFVKKLSGYAKWESKVSDVKEKARTDIDEFERKYGVKTDEWIDELIVALIMLDGIERTINGEDVDVNLSAKKGSLELIVMREKLKTSIRDNLKKHVISTGLSALEMKLSEQANLLKRAEELRRQSGSGGMVNNDGNCPAN